MTIRVKLELLSIFCPEIDDTPRKIGQWFLFLAEMKALTEIGNIRDARKTTNELYGGGI